MSKLKKFLNELITTQNTENSNIPFEKYTKTTQEDARQRETSKRVGAIFEQQAAQLGARAFIAHEIGCDEWTCTKNPCWKWEPDKIVSEPYKVDGKESKKENEYYRDQKYRKFTDEELNYILKGHYQKLFEEKREKHPNVVAAAHAEKIAK